MASIGGRSSAVEHLTKTRGELPGVIDESGVVAGEPGRLDSEPFPEGSRRAFAQLADRLPADSEHEVGRARSQCLQVGLPAHAGRKLVTEPELFVGVMLRIDLAAEPLDERLLGHRDVRLREEEPPGADAVAGERRRPEFVGEAALFDAVGQQFQEWGFVGDDDGYEVAVRLQDRQAGHGAAAGAEDARGSAIDVLDERREIIGALLGTGALRAVVQDAPFDPARVGGEDGVIGGELVGEGSEGVGIHRRADQDEQRSLAAELVVQTDIGEVERGRGGVHRVLLVSEMVIVHGKGCHHPGSRRKRRGAIPSPREIAPPRRDRSAGLRVRNGRYSRRMSAFGTLATPVGVVGVVSDGGAITRVTWRSTPPDGSVVVSEPGADPLLTEALAQLRAYFDGRLRCFDVPVDLGVQTAATKAVLLALHETVAQGETITYGGLAARSGTAVPARGIGSIMGANPVPLIVPCHRVVAGDGLGGYSGGDVGRGLETKRWLLEHEGALPTSLF